MENNNNVGGFLVALGLGFFLGHWCQKEHHTPQQQPKKPCPCKDCVESQPQPRPRPHSPTDEEIYYNEGVDFSTDYSITPP